MAPPRPAQARALPNPIPIADMKTLMKAVRDALWHRLQTFNSDTDPEYVITNAVFKSTGNTIQALDAAELHNAAAQLSKLTDVIKGQTAKLNKLKADLLQIQQVAGQAQAVLDAIAPVLPFL